MNSNLKAFVANRFPNAKSDLFAIFFERAGKMAKLQGFVAMVTMQSWMFLSSFESFRRRLLETKTIATMAHFGARAFSEISGEVVQTASLVMYKQHLRGFRPAFFRLNTGNEEEKRGALLQGENRYDRTTQDDFKQIPGSPVAYWISSIGVQAFSKPKLTEVADTRAGMSTSNNQRFLRYWFEVDHSGLGIGFETAAAAKESSKRWFPYQKGGEYRKWYGNNEYVINWQNDGAAIKEAVVNNPSDPDTTHWSRRIYNTEYFFKPGITWTVIASKFASFRFFPKGHIIGHKGPTVYTVRKDDQLQILGFLNSHVSNSLLKVISPNMGIEVGHVSSLPIGPLKNSNGRYVQQLVASHKDDWDSFEISWDFRAFPFLRDDLKGTTVIESFDNWECHCNANLQRIHELETENNRLFIEAYPPRRTLGRSPRRADHTRTP